MKYNYTAIFAPTEDGTELYCSIPDLPGCVTTATDYPDAIEQITDAASGWLVIAEDENLSIPSATPQQRLKLPPNASCSVICIDTLLYRNLTDERSVRKNVSLPAWMATLADKKGINCSQVLQEGLMERLDIA